MEGDELGRVSPPMAATQDSIKPDRVDAHLSEGRRVEAGLDSGLSWGFKDDQQEARRLTAAQRGIRPSQRKDRSEKVITPQPQTQGLPRLTLDPNREASPSWLQPGQAHSLLKHPSPCQDDRQMAGSYQQ